MDNLNDKDYFSHLPNELIEAILLDARIRGPPSKRFLPIFRRVFYRLVRFDSYNGLALLCRTAQSQPERMLHVDLLAFGDEVAEDEDIPVDEGIPSNGDLSLLLRSLSNVRTPEISGSKRLAELILYSDSPLPCHTTVQDLTLNFPLHRLTGHNDHFEPLDLVRRLSKFHSLEYLHYTTSPRQTVCWNTLPTVLPPMPFLASIRSLHLGGTFCTNPTFSYLGSLFPSLTHISLENPVEESSPVEIFEFLDRVPNPDHIESLTLLLDEPSPPDTSRLLRNLDRFANLQDLIFPRLPSLPLRFLAFDYNPSLTSAALATLLSGSAKIKTLELLHLDNLLGEKGRPIPSDLSASMVTRQTADEYGWRLASWTEEFGTKDLEELAALGEKEGITVDGLAFHAKEVEVEWSKEVRRHRRAQL